MIAVNPPPSIRIPRAFQKDPEVREFYRLFNHMIFQLWKRTGGGTDDVAGIGQEASDNDNLASALIGQVAFLKMRLDDLDNIEPESIPQSPFICVTKSANYTAIDHNFVNAKNGATISLPQYPAENAVVIIRNGDDSNVRLSGNGKNINGSSAGNIYRKGTAIELHYFIDTDEWFAR